MEHPFFTTPTATRAEALRWLSIAEKLLSARDLMGSKSFAMRAREADSTLTQADEILTVLDTLLAGDRRICNNQPDFYSILRLTPPQGADPELVARQYRSLVVLLNPQTNCFPFADQAFRLVIDAWSVLSNPSGKSLYDKEIGFYHRQPDPYRIPVPVPVPAPQQNSIFSQPQQVVHSGETSGATHFTQAPQVHAHPRAGPVFGGPTREPQNFMGFHSGSNIVFGSDNYSTYDAYNEATHQQLDHNYKNNREKHSQHDYSNVRDNGSVPNVNDNVQQTVTVEDEGNVDRIINEENVDRITEVHNITVEDEGNVDRIINEENVDIITEGQTLTVEDEGHGNRIINEENVDRITEEHTVTVEDEGHVDRIINEENADGITEENEEVLMEEERDGTPVNTHGIPFWTACPYCYYMYEYPKVYVDCTMRCQNCKRAFQAVVIPSPPPVVDGQDAYFCCWGFMPMGFSMDMWNKNNSSTTKTGYGGRKPSAPRVYIDEDDDIFADISSSSESDVDWQNNENRKRKNTARNVRGRQACRMTPTRRSKKVLAHKGDKGVDGQYSFVSDHATAGDVSKVGGRGPGGRKQPNRVTKSSNKLDLNVELSNEAEEIGVNSNKGNDPGRREDDNMEGIGFFEGLDELFNNLPILKAS